MPDQILWEKVLSELQLEVSPAVFNTMFKQTALNDFSDGVITVACTSSVIAHLVESRYYALIKRAVDRHVGTNTSIVFTVDGSLKNGNAKKQYADAGPLFQVADTFLLTAKKHGLCPDYTFETFAVSGTNQLAFAAASHVAKNSGNSYNPLFFYGGVGVGKTHLMHAIVHTLLHRNPTTRVVLCAGEEFTNEIIDAIRTKTTASFRSKFRSAHILCIDDIQFIAGKDAVQEEFFHTFNAILRGGGQIVLTSDRPPSEILKLEARLKSRLEGGLLVDIAPPDFELRVAIFLIKAKNKGLDFPVSLAKIIAASITDTRGLEGMLTRILSESQIKDVPLSEELVLKVLGKTRNGESKTFQKIPGNSPSKEVFINTVCSYFSLKPTQLKGKKREKSLVFPRQILMYLLRTELNLPLTEIGFLIGGRDHTTVIHGVEKISSFLLENEKARVDISGIKKLIYG